MATTRVPVRTLCTMGAALLILSGCDKLGNDDTDYARAALERNEQLSIVAFDKNAHTFTVKMRDTGELRVVRADQIVGNMPEAEADSAAAAKPAATVAAPAAPDTATTASTSTSSPSTESATAAERPAADLGARDASGTAVVKDAATGKVLASNATADEPAKAESGPDRKTLASGPGYSVKAGDGTPPPAIRLASRSSDIPSPTRGIALERRYEPMICQGQRMLHIDGRNLEFEGDAISAEDGCEIHITNSHIIAHGVGISARAANVYLQNSVVEGDSGSVSASEGAQVYTQSSTFKGLSRSLDSASFHDLGNTVWQ